MSTKANPLDCVKGKTVLIGVCGGIAAYKVCTAASRLVQAGADVHVMMTKNATEFVTPLTFESLTHNRVVVDTFDRNFTWEVEHVSLAKKTDVVLIAPATANVIAKLACGIADDFLTTTVLACRCPVIFAPAMNGAMLNNKATKTNIATLISRGFQAVYGDSGYLACGDVGDGRMAEPEVLAAAVAKEFCVGNDFVGKTVLITAGATRAMVDPVRFLTNRSSGKMGYALAMRAYARGAHIILIKGHTDKFDYPDAFEVIGAETTHDMLNAVKENAARADIYIMAAAPCDYECEQAPQKIKSETLQLKLKKTTDIARTIGETKGEKKLVIFAAETQNCEQNARSKLKAKNADLIVANDVTKSGAGFDVDTNIATLITDGSVDRLDIMTKTELADRILDKISEL